MANQNYEVKSGDTLWKICKEAFNLKSDTDIANKVSEISKKNGISEDSIFIGQEIKLFEQPEVKQVLSVDNSDISVFNDSKVNNPELMTNYWSFQDSWVFETQKPVPDIIIKEGFANEPLDPAKYQLMSNAVRETSGICSEKTLNKLRNKKQYTDKDLEIIANTKEYSKKEINNIIEEFANKYGVDPILIKAVIQKESKNNQFAKNRWSGASGLMQLMPKTAKWLGCDNVFDAKQNIKAGVKYLAYLLKKYDGNVNHALGAYNFGEGNYDKYLKGQKKLPKETVAYIPEVLNNYNQIATA